MTTVYFLGAVFLMVVVFSIYRLRRFGDGVENVRAVLRIGSIAMSTAVLVSLLFFQHVLRLLP